DLEADIAQGRHHTATKSHIDALGDQVGLAIAEHEFQAHARMRGEKFAHPFDAKKIQATRLPHRRNVQRRLARRR
ncbi:hypothetical protein XGA_2589, partial [Xanthomonas hortorum ATCC 19865]